MNWRFHTAWTPPSITNGGERVQLFQAEDYNLEDMARNVGNARRRISYDDSAFHTRCFQEHTLS